MSEPDYLRLIALTCGLPSYEQEVCFAPPRKWRVDYAFTEQRVAIEVEGAAWTQGRHTRGSGYVKDMEKYNALAASGWRLLRFTPEMLSRDPAGCGALIRKALEAQP